MKGLLFFTLAFVFLTVSACSPGLAPNQPEQASPVPVVQAEETVFNEPTTIPLPSETPVPAPAFEAATYRDEVAGFEFDYPVGWAFDGGEAQSRGSYVQFYSWDWQPGQPVDPLPEGGTILTVTNQLWDPKNDIEAFVNQRKLAWEASGISILSEERLTLADGRPAAQFVIKALDDTQAYFLLTTNGENYLVFSGNGDLDVLANISQTVRPIQ
jgi:hypothetical protein